jgi:hypothetical protein
MRKELRPTHELHSCEVCQRTILKGERTEAYLAPGGRRHLVCELCVGRAEREGWIRESAHAEHPVLRAGPEPRRSMLDRLGRWRAPEPNGHGTETNGDGEAVEAQPDAARPEPASPEPQPEAPSEPGSRGGPDAGIGSRLGGALRPGPRKSPRQVRAVPTNAQVKVERALDVFNATEHRRTVAGLARTLGEPWVSAQPSAEAPSEVALVVAWELSWYQYRVDLGDAHDPVTLLRKGHELTELTDEDRVWNGSVDGTGALVPAVGAARP